MAYAKNEIIIDRPIADVFDFIANGENNARWRGGILEVTRTSAQNGLGATYRQAIGGPFGRKVPLDYRVTEYQRPTALQYQRSTGIARPTGRFELTELEPDRTSVVFEMSWKSRDLRRIFDNMITMWMATEVASLGNLKDVLEQAGSTR
jgi:uncharacterized protein YndB with AHSA1/START domain